eukprot:8759287-Prorocentrum_lima.AAC.1
MGSGSGHGDLCGPCQEIPGLEPRPTRPRHPWCPEVAGPVATQGGGPHLRPRHGPHQPHGF